GPLASINSQIGLRRHLALAPALRHTQDVREPLGARASALYSIAQRMQSRRRKLFHYRQAARLATPAIERDEDGARGSLSIRAHASMRMALLGHAWKLWEAHADFERSLALREGAAASPASVGECKTDLGFCSVLVGKPRRGLVLLRDGVELL